MSYEEGFKGDLKQGIFDAKNEKREALKALFPSAVKDGQLDVEALREELGYFEEVGAEKYGLSWSGKQNAKKIALEDSIGRTLKFVSEESVSPDTTQNLYIEGDNLEVLKLLRQNYYGAIKMIYIDPPYNTGNDFVYRDNFNMLAVESDVAEGIITEEQERLQRNLKSTNRFHANWLNMMYPRLKVAKDLLSDDGVIFISIDENEQDNLKKISNEIFGESNLIGELIWEATTQPINSGMARFNLQKKTESILLYAKNKGNIIGFNLQQLDNELKYPHDGKFGKCRFEIIEKSDAGDYSRPTMKFSILGQFPREGKRWQIGQSTAQALEKEGKIEIVDGIVKKAVYPQDEIDKQKFAPFWSLLMAEKYGTAQKGKELLNTLMGTPIGFDTVKPIDLIIYLMSLIEGDYTVLDFFSGTATTAHAAIQLNAQDGGNRKFICVQIPEETEEKSEAYKAGYSNICEIGKERIRRAGNKIKEEIELVNVQLKVGDSPKVIPDIGFKVFKTADTMIRWNYEDIQLQRAYLEEVAATSEVLEGQGILGENMMNKKDQLDFMPYATDIDVVYEILLRQRDIPLSASIRQLEEIGRRTYLFDESFLVCLETEITTELIEKITAIRPLPIKFIFRDSAFEDDINLKDETIRLFKALVARNTNKKQSAYTVEFI